MTKISANVGDVNYTDARSIRKVADRLVDDVATAWILYREEEETADLQAYKEEMETYREEAMELSQCIGLNQLKEEDWIQQDGKAPRVDSGPEHEDYPWDRGTAEDIAAVYNLLERVKEVTAAFPEVPEEDGYEVGLETSVTIRRDLKDRYDVMTTWELHEEVYVDEGGEPLYDSRMDLRSHIWDIARSADPD